MTPREIRDSDADAADRRQLADDMVLADQAIGDSAGSAAAS